MIISELFLFDDKIREEHSVFCGTDEAGRGPLAGPVYAGAVILPRGLIVDGLNDSKKLTEKRREAVYEELLLHKDIHIGVGVATPEEIDRINILNASMLAMRRAVGQLPHVDLALVDGNAARDFPVPALCVVGGDHKSASIAAASVVAKVLRDRAMLELDARYPGYGFAKHKGYPTKAHYEALRELGPSAVHRRSFLKKLHGEA